ncbi:DMT family transporter [Romboutsia sp.]|uniref:DMT family transporter n=1 Tax=Romboutsia sp. TaxID=1965302 RepID=UPI003F3B2C99
MLKKYIGEIGLILTAVIWGSGFVTMQLALDNGFTPLQIITMRFFIAAVLINTIFFKQIKANITKEAVKAGSIIGVFLFIAFVVQTIGLVYTTPSKNAFITAANVVIVPFIGFIIYKRKLDKIGIISSITTLVGIGILSLQADFSVNIGDFLTLICAFGFAFHIFFTSEFVQKHHPMVLIGVQFTVTFILSFISQIVMGEGAISGNPAGYVGILYSAIFCTTVAFLMQTICQKKVDGTKTAIILATESVFGTIFSIIILNEVVTVRMILGCIIIFVSIIMAETKFSFLKKKDTKLEPTAIDAANED